MLHGDGLPKSSERLEFHTWHVQVFPRNDQKLTRSPPVANSTYSGLLASPYSKAVLTSASMIDLFVPSSHLVIAREITVRIATSSVELACYQTCLGNWMLFCSLICDDSFDADHSPSSSLFHGFSCDNTVHLHSLKSLHLSLRFASITIL